MKKFVFSLVITAIMATPFSISYAQISTQTKEQHIASLQQMAVLLQKQLEETLANQKNKDSATVIDEVSVVSSVAESEKINKLQQQLRAEEDIRKKLEAEVNDLNKHVNTLNGKLNEFIKRYECEFQGRNLGAQYTNGVCTTRS